VKKESFAMTSILKERHEHAALQFINPEGLARPSGYTHLVAATGGTTIYLSGQIAIDVNGSVIGKGDFAAQARQVFENLKIALQASRASFSDIVRFTVFLKDMAHLDAFQEIRNQNVKPIPTASSLVQVSGFVLPDLLLEVDAIAVVR
jgi:enamine deaminase RidA (YjgF/YER057c/UK114 family)